MAVARKSRPPKGRGGRQVRAATSGELGHNGATARGQSAAKASPVTSRGAVNGHDRALPGRRGVRSIQRQAAAAAPQMVPAKNRNEHLNHRATTNGAAMSLPVETTALRPLAERQVIARCLKGDAAAWSIIYQRFQEPLASNVRAFLGRAGNDRNLVDEICARVWYALVRNNFELLARFDVERGVQLTTFLTLLAKTQARLLMRSERRRRTREQVASKPEAHPPDDASWSVLADHDFLATLSPAEQAFFQKVLVADVVSPPAAARGGEHYSRQYAWQLRHRVRRKLEDFLR